MNEGCHGQVSTKLMLEKLDESGKLIEKVILEDGKETEIYRPDPSGELLLVSKGGADV